MKKDDLSVFEETARKNLKLSPKKMEAFIREGIALRRNLKLRQKQQKERQKKCMHSK